MTTAISYQPKHGDNMRSICTRFRMKPAVFRALNPTKVGFFSGPAAKNTVTVMASKDHACGRDCVLLVKKTGWASCKCSPTDTSTEYIPMMTADSRWTTTPEPFSFSDPFNINGDDDVELLPFYPDAIPAHSKASGRASQPEKLAWGITNSAYNHGERARFPVPTMHTSKAAAVGDKVYNLGERAKFPTPTYASGAAAECGDTTYNHGERARFPVPAMATTKASAIGDKVYNLGERAKFPTPVMATAEASECGDKAYNHGERARFPVPTFAEPAVTAACYAEQSKFPTPTLFPVDDITSSSAPVAFRGQVGAAHAADVELMAFVTNVKKAAPRVSKEGKVSLKWLFGMTKDEVTADFEAEQEAIAEYEAGHRC